MGKCVCMNGSCYVFGGEVWAQESPSQSKKISSSRTVFAVDVYDTNSDSWSPGTVRSLPAVLEAAPCSIC